MGSFFVFEGADGVGKSTLSRRVNDQLGFRRFSFPGRKAGTLGHVVYDIHHNPANYDIDNINDVSLQVLHVAAHIDLIESRIRPVLAQGQGVVLDRFWWSTLIYGRHNGVDEESLRAMIELEKLHWQDTLPDVVFLIDRPEPFGEKPDNWDRLRSRYSRFATEEDHPYSIEIVKNTSSVAEAVDGVLDTIEQLKE